MDWWNATKTGTIGAIVTTVAFFIPFLNAIAPIFGGGVAGYLYDDGVGPGAVTGIIMGLLMVVPAIGIGVLGFLLAGLGAVLGAAGGSDVLTAFSMLGGFGVLGYLLFVIFITIFSMFIGLIGGAIGGAIAE